MEEITMYLEEAETRMQQAVSHTGNELTKIRAGKAMPNMLNGLTVDYYGSATPIEQVASVTTPDARTLAIKPWEKKTIPDIERAIINSDLGLNPQNDGELIRITIPMLTGERRNELVKQARAEAENGKVSIRNIRKDTNQGIKGLKSDGASEDDIKKGEEQVQKLTDKYSAKIDELLKKKETDITTV